MVILICQHAHSVFFAPFIFFKPSIADWVVCAGVGGVGHENLASKRMPTACSHVPDAPKAAVVHSTKQMSLLGSMFFFKTDKNNTFVLLFSAGIFYIELVCRYSDGKA